MKRGETATVILTEEELSSRGARYLTDSSVPGRDLQVHLCANQNKGQAALLMNVLGRDVSAVVTGHLDVSMSPPRVVVDGLQIGQLPEQVAATVANQLLDAARIQAPTGIKEVTTTSMVATIKGQR